MLESIKEKLKKVNCKPELDKVFSFMESTGINFIDTNMVEPGPYGIASFYGVYLDIDRIINRFGCEMISYIFLHEIGHFKRITKMGKEHVLSMLSHDDFYVFSDHIIEEEMIADRYAVFVYKKLTKNILSREITQQLNIKYNRDKFVLNNTRLFGNIKNNEESYMNFLNNFIK